MKCLICSKEFTNQRGLSCHVKKQHDITIHEYKIQFNLYRRCQECNEIISEGNKSGHCNKHRDRTGVNNPFYGKTHDRSMIERTKLKLSEISKELWCNEEYRKKIKNTTTGLKRSSSFKIAQSKRISQWYKDNPNQRELRSEHMKKTWADGKIQPNINSINESKGERELLALCKELFPSENVRKTTIRIDGKWFYPDIRIGKNLIIEYYGDYWHANPEKFGINETINFPASKKSLVEDVHKRDEERINKIKKGGFNVLIIWQSEFSKQREQVIKKIKGFYNEEKNF